MRKTIGLLGSVMTAAATADNCHREVIRPFQRAFDIKHRRRIINRTKRRRVLGIVHVNDADAQLIGQRQFCVGIEALACPHDAFGGPVADAFNPRQLGNRGTENALDIAKMLQQPLKKDWSDALGADEL